MYVCVREEERDHTIIMKRERKSERTRREHVSNSSINRETPNPSYHTKKGEVGVTNPSPTKEKNTARASIEKSKQNSGGASISKQPTNQFFLFLFFSFPVNLLDDDNDQLDHMQGFRILYARDPIHPFQVIFLSDK